MNTVICQPPPRTDVPATQTPYSNAIGYLRAFVVLLVVLHHAVLAYHPFAPPPIAPLSSDPQWWRAFPVVDSERWMGFALIVGFNDVFFMSLMFFLSGLFVWSSLRRKGVSRYLKERTARLGIPFILGASLVAPLAYYPAYAQRTAHASSAGWWQQWLAAGSWPSGPVWFIAVLLVFDCLAAITYAAYPKWADFAGRLMACLDRRPGSLFATLVSLSLAAYVPMSLAFNPFSWSAFGPFTFQTSRILLYLMYFTVGIAAGAFGIERGIFARGGALAERCWAWCVLAAIAFFAVIVGSLIPGETALLAIYRNMAFALSCTASIFAIAGVFVRFAQKRNRVWDSLRDNSYGIYLIHYAFCSWLQYLLLTAPLSGVAKGVLVFLAALALSWWVASWARGCVHRVNTESI